MTEIDIGRYRSMQGRRDMQGKSIVYTKPKEIGSFSLDGKRKFTNDRSQLSFLDDSMKPPKNMHLSDGYPQRFVKKDENIKERLDKLLRWFVDTDIKSIGEFPDFILSRGSMTKIMCTPYQNEDSWISRSWSMAAEKFGSTIYISEIDTADAQTKRLTEEEENKMIYWGFRFEKYMTRSDCVDNTPVDQNEVIVNTNEAFYTVMRARLNAHDIMHSAEVDCCLPAGSDLDPPDNYVELKTNKKLYTSNHKNSFYHGKAKRWWAQSYLAGVPQITCGFRDKEGVIVEIHDYKTSELPIKTADVEGDGWDTNVMLLFLEEFFTDVKKAFENSADESVMIFSWNQGDDKIGIERFGANSEHRFLPEWYLSKLRPMQLEMDLKQMVL